MADKVHDKTRWLILSSLLLLFMLFLFSGFCTASVRAESDPVKRILFLSSYSPAFPTFFLQIEGLREELGDGGNILDVEFLDTKRFPEPENYRRFDESLRYKLERLPQYDIVIVSDDDGLNYVMANKEKLFPGVPIVFLGINNRERAESYGQDPLVTGVVEAISLEDTIRMALNLSPEAKGIVAITDGTSSGHGDLISYLKLQDRFGELSFKVLDLSDLSYEELGRNLEKLTGEDLVVLLSAYVDRKGKVMTFPDSLDFILSHLNQPLYHPYYHGLGDGVLGGRVISHYEQGKQAGKLAKRILDGESISNIQTVLESPNPYIVDYHVLEKYGLDERRLPEDVLLINKPETVLDKYFWVIVAVLLGFSLQIGLILFLLWNIKKRKNAEELIRSKNMELKNSNQELFALNKEICDSNNKLIIINQELNEAYSEISKNRDQIYHILYNDSLTDLNNRLGIMQELEDLIAGFTAQKKEFLLLFVDIDNFKNINDTFGHEMGDQVIREAANRLKELDPGIFRVGRFGGDEFLILCKDTAAGLEKKIELVQECLRNQMIINENHFYLTTSIGVVQFPKDGQTKNDLMKKADLALYEAKCTGKNKHVTFECSMGIDFENKVRFQAELKEAFARREFYIKYQPFVSPVDGLVLGFEALIRWDSPKYGEVPAYKLITNAEEMGIIVEIGNWVFEEACRFAKEINQQQGRQLGVSVNISVAQIMYDNFLKDFADIIQRVRVSPETLCLEMTETIMIQSIEMGQDLIRDLKEFGFKVALDDFGTGYSSLSYLRSLPVDIIKIDKAFIDGIECEGLNQYTLKAIVELAHQLGFAVVAEGVENFEQVEYLIRHECDAIQGFYYSKPLSEKDAFAFVEKATTLRDLSEPAAKRTDPLTAEERL